jgi:hypothetical protein
MLSLRSLSRFRTLTRVGLDGAHTSRPHFIENKFLSQSLQQRCYSFPIGPQVTDQGNASDDEPRKNPKEPEDEGSWRPTGFKMLEAALTTLASVAVLGAIGYGYTRYCMCATIGSND